MAFLLFVVLLPANAQTGNTIISVGQLPRFPQTPKASAGQILDLFVQGVGGKLTARVTASEFPLPTTLAGISVSLTQTPPPPGTSLHAEPVPLLAVTPESTCLDPKSPAAGTCGAFADVTVQVPFDFVQSSDIVTSGFLVVSENGVSGASYEVFADLDVVHALTVTHADGTLVTLNNPAKGGEVLIMWALGLGQSTPAVPTGQPSPAPAAVTTETFQLYFDYRPNSPPYRPYCVAQAPCPTAQPLFSGLTPGYAGLYQVNFVIPPPPAGTPACNNNTPAQPGDPSSIYSNVTVSLFYASLDGVGICVDPAR